MVKIRVRVSGHEKAGRLARRLRAAADGGLRRDLGAELMRDARPVLALVRRRVLGASFPALNPSQTPQQRSTGLRLRLAEATDLRPLESPPGARLFVDGSAVDPSRPSRGHSLAKLSDGELKRRWRHQTFGDWRRPVTQAGDPWFFASIRPERPRFAAGVNRAMEKTARRIEGG